MTYSYDDIAKMIDHSLLNPSSDERRTSNEVATSPWITTAPAFASCPIT